MGLYCYEIYKYIVLLSLETAARIGANKLYKDKTCLYLMR